jgi:hypothetical protein
MCDAYFDCITGEPPDAELDGGSASKLYWKDAIAKQVELVAAYADLCLLAPANVSMYCIVTGTNVRLLAAEVVSTQPHPIHHNGNRMYGADGEHTPCPPATMPATALFDAVQTLGPARCLR